MSERSALATAAAVRSGETTALQECEAAIARIELRDGPINAVVVRDFERAREAARLIDIGPKDERRVLLGVPMTVKESYDVAGLPTTWGFEEHRDFVPAADAAAVQRLKAAGAVILGKTNVPPALADLQSTNPVYGRTSNPHDHARVAGGSSGGSAAALASGMVALEIGSDIGGSIRVPAHFCGVWGHKPTYGVCSREGHHFPGTDGHPGPLSVVGPLARDAGDLAAALDIMADVRLPRARIGGAEGLRLLVVTANSVAAIDPAIAAAIGALGDAFAAAGASVMRDSSLLPDHGAQFAAYMKLLSVTLARGEPSPDGISATLPDWFAMLDEQARTTRAWRRLFADYDAVIAPVLGITAFEHSDVDLRERTLTIGGASVPFGMQFAYPGLATYPGLPATAVPIAMAGGLPIGCQIITDTYRDHDAIAIARLAHQLFGAEQHDRP